jgi:predicted transcriptional regulator
MGRPPAKELTERELQVMHAFWNRGETAATVAEVRDDLAASGLDLAYTTVATLVRILTDKQFLIQTNEDRPFLYRPSRSYEDVSRRLLGDVIDRVFRGSREMLLVRLMEQKALSSHERDRLREILDATEKEDEGKKKGGRAS